MSLTPSGKLPTDQGLGRDDYSNEISEALQAARQLTVYRKLLSDRVVMDFLTLLDQAAFGSGRETELLEAYHVFLSSLIQRETPGSWPDAWQRHLVSMVMLDENPFSLKAEAAVCDEIGEPLQKAAAHDLRCLQRLCGLDARRLKRFIVYRIERNKTRNAPEIDLLDWGDLVFDSTPGEEMAQVLLNSTDWGREITGLAEHYRSRGTGEFARYPAFRWENKDGQGRLRGLQHIDEVSFEYLVDYDSQKQQLIANTDHFLDGLPASNVLLYGKRGTGKSSMVKALLNRYSNRGLRLVEVAKENLSDLQTIVGRLRRRAFRFILFVDDLSFEEFEVEYKGLKAVLEGGIEPLPKNVLIYATSNRRHIVREYFQDRNRDDEIHRDDTVQEKLSFADRFGVTIFFPSPSQQVYLRIVEELAHQRGLTVGREELTSKALEWERWHNGLSGRTARQFVDNLTAEMRCKTGDKNI